MSRRHHTGPDHRRFHRDLGRAQRHARDHSAADRMVKALRSAKGVARNRLTPGSVVIARVPYVDSDDDKVRPVLVVEVDHHRVTVRPMTTSRRMVSLRGGGHEIVRNGRRCWVLLRTVVIDLIDVLSLEPDRMDEALA